MRSLEDWVPLPLDKPLYANLDEDAVIGFQTAIENGYQNDLGGTTRFPGLTQFKDLGGNARVYLHDFNGDLIAADSEGQVHRLDRNAISENVTAVPVAGGRRVVFAKTDRELLMAAGGQIVRLRNNVTEVLSPDAPLTTHVAWLDGFTIAIEINSQRFFHSPAGHPDQWDPLDTFSADGDPDNINSLLVTPFRELMLGGENSVEQFERQAGDPPFTRRWAIGAGGVKLPYAFSFVDNSVMTINNRNELVRMVGQVPEPVSDHIGRLLQRVDDWDDAWMTGPILVEGAKVVILQMPKATNPHGTAGLTLLYDYPSRKFSTLYDWDSANGVPTRWRGWSYLRLWDRHFIGGEGKIYELDPASFRNGGDATRWLVRTSHLSSKGPGVTINGFRLRLVRGRGTSDTAASIRVRCSRDGKPFGSWITRSLGKAGQRNQQIEFGAFGAAGTHMFEISCHDDTAVDLIAAEVKAEPFGR